MKNKIFNNNRIIGTTNYPWETHSVTFTEYETSTYASNGDQISELGCHVGMVNCHSRNPPAF